MRLSLFSLASAGMLLAGAAACRAADSIPGLYYWEADRLPAAKALLARDEDDNGAEARDVHEAAEMLREEADDALRRKPLSVMDKEGTPPSGDKHDYISYSVYWWPDPTKPDGLPFIRRDGHTNHQQKAKGDRDRLEDMILDVETLALAHYFLDKDKYGEYAQRLLRTWFIDAETKMNPHLRYAQAVPGENDGRGSGIIDARDFIQLLEAIALLEHTGALSDDDQRALDAWFAAYAKWMLTSDFGRKERKAKNNHGTWYAAQAARVALFVGDEETARELVEDARDRLSAIKRDGSQPEELRRTRSLHYCLFHLSAFACLARYGESLGVDLWRHEAESGGSIDRGLAFVAPYVVEQEKWPHEQINDYRLDPESVQVFRIAAARYRRPEYRRVLDKAPRSDRDRVYAPLLFAP